ncbi:urease accessory protein UreD [Methylobacterium sp. A54F]
MTDAGPARSSAPAQSGAAIATEPGPALATPGNAASPARQRSIGHVALTVGPAGVAAQSGANASSVGSAPAPTEAGAAAPTRIRDLAESGPSRLRFPRPGPGATALEAVLVNTAGGVACGDAFSVSLTAEAGSRLVLTTTAAEKIYRSDGPVSTLATRVDLRGDARLAWLPQETILYDRARLARRFEADLAPGARLLAFEAIALGRAAHGERLTDAHLHDTWRIRRAGRLVYADDLRVEGPVTALMAGAAVGGGAGATALLLDVSPEAEGRLEEARARLDAIIAGTPVEAAASAWNGHLAVRLLAPTIGMLRVAAARFLVGYRGVPLPRVWQG